MVYLNKRGAWIAALFPLLLACQANAATDSATAQKLVNSVATSSEIRVIITFDSLRQAGLESAKRSRLKFKSRRAADLTADSVSRLQSRAAFRAQVLLEDAKFTSRVAHAQNQLLQRLPFGKFKGLRQYKHVPQMALNVDSQTLQMLLDDPLLSISENLSMKPFLAQSVPRVFSTQGTSPYDGNDQWVVAILDTGTQSNHPFLAGKVISEACYSTNDLSDSANPVTSLCPGQVENSTSSGSGEACDASIKDCDHGTHVAGIAVGNGVTDGVARLGKIISIQVFSKLDETDIFDGGDRCFPADICAVAFVEDVISGLERVYALRNTYDIAAVNISAGAGEYSGTCDTQPEKVAIDLLRAAGIATIVAAGNSGLIDKLPTPACISSAIAVGSSLDSVDVASNFSNVSTALDLYAPGETITSSALGGGFTDKDGTSMAAAHVSGAWAVLKQAGSYLTVDQIETLLMSYGPEITKDLETRRRLDMDAALANVPGEDNGGIMFPIRLSNGKVVIINL